MSDKFNQTTIALLGAFLLIAFRILDYKTAMSHVDGSVLFLLAGMMIMVGITAKTGVFQWLAIKSAKAVKGNPLHILWIYAIITAVISAFLDNVTTLILIVPVTLTFTKLMKLDPFPFLFCEVFASNMGGTATLIGDPPNILIGSYFKLSFVNFVTHVAICIAICMLAFLIIATLVFKKSLKATAEDRANLEEVDDKGIITKPAMLRQCLVILGIVIIGFFAHSTIDIEPAVVAMLGATLMMLITGENVREALQKVEWETIFFFIGLFVMVGALVETGFIKILSSRLLAATKGDPAVTTSVILWMSAGLSAIINNIPFVATMLPLLKDLNASISACTANGMVNNPLIWALSLGTCLGGNGTIIGASANVVAFAMAKREGTEVSFMKYLVYGLPMMILSIIVCHVYLHVRFLGH
jgi:Na+/H+ antiporter NhaD/arsenite permease-like protein